MPTTTARPFTPVTTALYFTDNGAILCGAHLGTSAAYTGRDISGQPIQRIKPTDYIECVRAGFTPKCECCGRGMHGT